MRKKYWIFLIILTSLNLVHAGSMNLLDDEAYYWLWSKNLALGFVDHPPMVAIFVALGSFLKGELGLRLIGTLLHSFSLFLIWQYLLPYKRGLSDILPFFMIYISLPLLQIYGFVTTPDSPLLFFTVIFFIGYKGFLNEESWKNIFILAISMAGIMYSKYTGILVIGFTLFSNLRLLTKPRFYVAVIISLVLFSPQFYWLSENDWITMRFLIQERFSRFKIKYPFEYLLNIALIFNFLFIPIYYKILKKWSQGDLYIRALLFIVWGIFLFFLSMTIRGHVQPQWVVGMCVPLVILLNIYYHENSGKHSGLIKIAVFTLIVSVLMRLVMIIEIAPFKMETYGKEEWATELREIAGDRSVIFQNSYRNASTFSFYDGQYPVMSIPNEWYRLTQYNLLDFSDFYEGKEVILVSDFEIHRSEKYVLSNRRTYFVSQGKYVNGKFTGMNK